MISPILLFLLISSLFAKRPVRAHREPIILVPGLAASRLQYRENGGDWKTLWVSITDFNPLNYDKWAKRFGAIYDSETDTHHNIEGMESRPIDFGGIDGVYEVLPGVGLSGLFKKLVDALKEVGYEVGTNIFGAPFDFRLANARQILTNGMAQSLKELVEYAYLVNNQTKVHLLGHSCGCNFVHQLLTRYVDQDWVQKYVASFISTSGPFSGSFEAFAQILGPNFYHLCPLPAKLMHPLTRGMGGMFWMLPNANNFPQDYVVARIPAIDQTVTIGNMSQIFHDINNSNTAIGVQRTVEATSHLEAPNVPVHIIYSDQLDTVVGFEYTGNATNWYTKEPKKVYGDGDDTVPFESLTAPLKWANEQKEPVTVTVIHKVNHLNIIKHDTFVNTVVDLISSD